MESDELKGRPAPDLAVRSRRFHSVGLGLEILGLVLYFNLPALLAFALMGIFPSVLLGIAAVAVAAIAYALMLAARLPCGRKALIVCVLLAVACGGATFGLTHRAVRSWPPPAWGYGGDIMNEDDAVIVVVVTTGLPVAVATFNVVWIAALALFRRKLWFGWLAASAMSLSFSLAQLWVRVNPDYWYGWDVVFFIGYCSPPFISIMLLWSYADSARLGFPNRIGRLSVR